MRMIEKGITVILRLGLWYFSSSALDSDLKANSSLYSWDDRHWSDTWYSFALCSSKRGQSLTFPAVSQGNFLRTDQVNRHSTVDEVGKQLALLVPRLAESKWPCSVLSLHHSNGDEGACHAEQTPARELRADQCNVNWPIKCQWETVACSQLQSLLPIDKQGVEWGTKQWFLQILALDVHPGRLSRLKWKVSFPVL